MDSILRDRGANVLSPIVQYLVKMLGVATLRSSGYRPNVAGSAESLNKTLIQRLKFELQGQRDDWIAKLSSVLMALRGTPCTKSTAFLLQ